MNRVNGHEMILSNDKLVDMLSDIVALHIKWQVTFSVKHRVNRSSNIHTGGRDSGSCLLIIRSCISILRLGPT